MKRKILFITGTRADYGKIKSLIKAVEESEDFEAYIFVSGMHLSKQFGSTYQEIQKDQYKNVYIAYGLTVTNDMSYNLGSVICHLTNYVQRVEVDMIVVHGDRIDALAGAIVGAINNIRVAHIEGGEISGTIDESIRHAISKFAHIHMVCNEDAKNRLIQLGEDCRRIYIVGSPDIDIMLSSTLPEFQLCAKRYDIPFDDYAIFMYHPVTTECEYLSENIRKVIDALIMSKCNYIVVYPNNDSGSEIILNEYKRLEKNKHFRVIPSIRFEYFLTFLKDSNFIIGNSSAGIRESEVYGIPAIDIGNRQKGRYNLEKNKNIQSVREDTKDILNAICRVENYRYKAKHFGFGDSTKKFMNILYKEEVWNLDIQKKFVDLRWSND